MKHLLRIICAASLLLLSCQKTGTVSSIYGSWELTLVTDEKGDAVTWMTETRKIYSFQKGDYDTDAIGILYFQEWNWTGRDTGSFFYDSATNILSLDIIENSGTFEIKKLTREQMVLYEIDSHETYYFSRI